MTYVHVYGMWGVISVCVCVCVCVCGYTGIAINVITGQKSASEKVNTKNNFFIFTFYAYFHNI